MSLLAVADNDCLVRAGGAVSAVSHPETSLLFVVKPLSLQSSVSDLSQMMMMMMMVWSLMSSYVG